MNAWLNRRSMRTKLGLLTLASVLGLLTIALALVWQQYTHSLEQRQTQVQQAVETASGVLVCN